MRFEEKFLSLCRKTMYQQDYADAGKRKRHNRAVKALEDMSRALSPQEAQQVLPALLEHPDPRVRLYTVTACRKAEVLPKKAVDTLRGIIVTEPDTTLKMAASMLLKQYVED